MQRVGASHTSHKEPWTWGPLGRILARASIPLHRNQRIVSGCAVTRPESQLDCVETSVNAGDLSFPILFEPYLPSLKVVASKGLVESQKKVEVTVRLSEPF